MRLLFLAATSCALLLPQLSLAETLYKVEVLAFEHLSADREAEQWPEGLRSELELPNPNQARQLTPGSAAYQQLAPSNRALGPHANAIDNKGDYRVLFHQAWLQPAQPRATAQSIAIDETLDSGNKLEGVVTFYVSRYRHVEVDIALLEEQRRLGFRRNLGQSSTRYDSNGQVIVDSNANENNRYNSAQNNQPFSINPYGELVEYKVYRLNEDRRITDDDIHHLDNPAIGVLLRVVEVELAAAESPAAN